MQIESRNSKINLYIPVLLLTLLLIAVLTSPVSADTLTLPNVNLQIGSQSAPGGTGVLQLVITLTLLTLAPALVITMTSFTRIVVVLSFLRSSLATQQMPPNQVLIGLALFLTFFVMAPTFQQVNAQALQPYLKGEINTDTAVTEGMKPMRTFMFKQTREKDLALFVKMAKIDRPRNFDDIPNYVLIPSFIISELKTAFQIGFILFIPFLVIDMVVASALMSMGMMMLPPMMISLPFKILLFILVDGWNLVIQSLMFSFR
ncbi:MAG TPA: flagellar type III secretion system pore protein FliP [Syntrophomonadaceae bacterium]|nr:flagellar type III secretion system pore protein FliP [Syntrophomonadaceae bacterium]